MISSFTFKNTLFRQINHWHQAVLRLSEFNNLASASAWQGVDYSIFLILQDTLQQSIDDVFTFSSNLRKQIQDDNQISNNSYFFNNLQLLRSSYLKAEETIHFYTDAINSRTTPGIASLLRACDIMCQRSIQKILDPLGKKTPYVLTYIDKGVGASILKAGLRLWDGNISTIAAIKVTQHNLYRPTAIIHETGHQIAHALNWNNELAMSLQKGLSRFPEIVGKVFSSWSSEIAADAFAFVHTGYAAVAALHDVVGGLPYSVFAFRKYDPHPIPYLRVLLNIEMCQQYFGTGPWDYLKEEFKFYYNIENAKYPSVKLIKLCINALPSVVEILLRNRYSSFQNYSLSHFIPPENVSPKALRILEQKAGDALYTSHAWISNESLRILALIGYKIGLGTGDISALYKQQEEWMKKLGYSVELN